MSIIIQAAHLAELYHRGQARKYSGLPYIIHPTRVAGRVTLLPEATEEMVAAAWLHDTIEDTQCTLGIIAQACGPIVTKLVDELTNQKQPGLARAEQKELDRARLSQVSYEAMLIKACDRIDNLRDLPDNEFRINYAQESHRLCDQLTYAETRLAKHPLALELFSLATQLNRGPERAF